MIPAASPAVPYKLYKTVLDEISTVTYSGYVRGVGNG